MLTRSNAKGYAILAIIAEELSDEEWGLLHVEPYLNGRESGFAVQFYARKGKPDVKLVFSEARGTDSIVIYKGKSYEFSMQGNGLTEEIYRNAFYCGPDEYVKAARMIVAELRGTNEE